MFPLPEMIIAVGGFACLHLAWTCVQQEVVLISRLRLDAQLYDFPTIPLRPRRGPKPRKGARLPALQDRVAEAQQSGEEMELYWYGGETRRVRLLSDVALWYRRGQKPLPIRWVLVVNAEGDPDPTAFFCTCPACQPLSIVTAFVLRWNVEVTFEESCASRCALLPESGRLATPLQDGQSPVVVGSQFLLNLPEESSIRVEIYYI